MSVLFNHWSYRNLWRRVVSVKNLRRAFRRIRMKGEKALGSDGESIAAWSGKLLQRLHAVNAELLIGDYEPREIKECWISEHGKKRRIAVLCLRDRVVAKACCQVLSEVFDSRFNTVNFAYRPRRNRSQAALYCKQLIKSGARYWVKADIKDCFGSIRRRRLSGLIKRLLCRNTEPDLIRLLDLFVSLERRPRGIVQGGTLSPFFANLYLDEIDSSLSKEGYLFAHYGDDFVIGCRSQKDAELAMQFIREQAQQISLELNDKSRIVQVSETDGLGFCGFDIRPEFISLTSQSVKRMQTKAGRMVDEFFDSGAAERLQNHRDLVNEYGGLRFTRGRSLERKGKRLLKEPAITNFEKTPLPKYQLYLSSWLEQHEIVDNSALNQAIEPVLKLVEEKEKSLFE